MSMTKLTSTTEQIVQHILECLKSRTTRHEQPFPFCTLQQVLPTDVHQALLALPIEPLHMEGQRSKNNDQRTFLNVDFNAQHEAAARVAEAFQDERVTTALALDYGVPLEGAHTIMEMAVESGTASLVPHRDIGAKCFTCLLFLAEDPALQHAGTDLYTVKPEWAERVLPMPEAPREAFEAQTFRPTYAPNTAYFFIPTDYSWHGFDERELGGIRKTLILNYVGGLHKETYRNTHWLAFPNQAVKVNRTVAA